MYATEAEPQSYSTNASHDPYQPQTSSPLDVGKTCSRKARSPIKKSIATLACGEEEKNQPKRLGENIEKKITTMITVVHHIALIISSESCLEFYKLLGFQESFRKKRSYDTAVLMYGHGMQLEIFIDPRHPNRLLMEGPEPTGLRHFALAVDGKLEDEIERLKNATTEILEFGPIMTDWRGVRFLFVKDPDGLLVELHE